MNFPENFRKVNVIFQENIKKFQNDGTFLNKKGGKKRKKTFYMFEY